MKHDYKRGYLSPKITELKLKGFCRSKMKDSIDFNLLMLIQMHLHLKVILAVENRNRNRKKEAQIPATKNYT